MIRDAWFWYRDPANSTAELLIGEQEGELVAVSGYMRTDPLNWYLPGLLVEHIYRSTKLGRRMLTLTLEHLSATSPKEMVTWLVHSHNDAMLELSSKIGAVQDGSTLFRCGTEAEPSPYFRWRFHL
ncbi:MAG: GNAT family N-acetyltransferase [Ilumatobacteraceae bacterium]